MTKFLTTTLLATVALTGFALGTAQAGEEAPPPCTTKKFATKQVEKACKTGGRKAAKALMKKIVKKAKADGKDINCKSCHTSLKSFELKPDAVDHLKKLL